MNKTTESGNNVATIKLTIPQYIQYVVDNYKQTQQECQANIATMTEKIGKWITEEVEKEKIMKEYIDKQLAQLARSPLTAEPNYRAFRKLFGYNDEQVYQLQLRCPTPQALLEYYAEQDAQQLAKIIDQLQQIKALYKEIEIYCNYMLTNANNRSTYNGAVLADQGLQNFIQTKMSIVNKIGKEVMGLTSAYQRRKGMERLESDPIKTIDISVLNRSSN